MTAVDGHNARVTRRVWETTCLQSTNEMAMSVGPLPQTADLCERHAGAWQSARGHSISTLQQSTSNQRGIHLGHEWPPRNHAIRIADARMNPGFRPLGVRLSVACHVCVLSSNEELERTTPIWVPVGKSNRCVKGQWLV